MTTYYIVDCSTNALNKKVQFFGVAVDDEYSFWPLGYAYWHDHTQDWAGNFDNKIICEKTIDDLIRRIQKRNGFNCDVHCMKYEDFRELSKKGK